MSTTPRSSNAISPQCTARDAERADPPRRPHAPPGQDQPRRRLGELTRAAQIDTVNKARSFTSWLMVPDRSPSTPNCSAHRPAAGHRGTSISADDYRWFTEICCRLGASNEDLASQWNILVKTAAITGARLQAVTDDHFLTARTALTAAHAHRGRPSAARTISAHFHRLQLTLFQAGRITTLTGPTYRQPVSVTGWATVAPGFAATAHRYLQQVTVSLRPNTVKHIEHDLRQFGTWLADAHPEVADCAELHREHIEAFKSWLSTHPTPSTGKPLTGSASRTR